MKLLFGIVLIIVIAIYFVYKYFKINKSKNKKSFNFFDKDLKKFNEKLDKYCVYNDKCFISYYLVNFIEELIEQHGLKDTIDYIRNNRDEFTTDDGEYISIHSVIDDENYFFLYHHHEDLDNKNVIDAQESFNKSSICDKNICDIKKNRINLTKYADKHGDGFFEYNWFDPISKEIIRKRTYVKKMKGVNNTNIGGKDIYVTSGATIVSRESDIDLYAIGIYLLNMFIFILLWNLFGVDEDIINPYLHNFIFIFIIVIYVFNIFNYETFKKNVEIIEKKYNSINKISVGLASLGLAMSLFFSKLLYVRNKNTNKISIKYLSVSVIFAILSFIEYKTKKLTVFLNRKIIIKNTLLLNSIGFLIITIIFVCTKYL